MSALPEERVYTMEDIYNLPEGQRAELIDGHLFMMSPPKWRHQHVSGFLFNTLYNHIRGSKLPCIVSTAPTGVWLFKDDKTYVEPDIFVVCDEGKIDEDGCKGAPDFIIEILSKSTKMHDRVTKLGLYEQAGVREYWIVDPVRRKITKWHLEIDLDDEQYKFDDDIPVSICPGFSINLGAEGF